MMYKKLLLIIALITVTVNAQDTIHGKMKPVKNYTYIILNQLNTVNKRYVANAQISDGEFAIPIPKGTKPGMYRLEYDVDKNLYIDIIYNNENIDFEFHPEYPENLVTFNKSKDNKMYQSFIDQVSVLQNKLDSIQVKYFQTKDKGEEKKLNKHYLENLTKLKISQTKYLTKSKGMLANAFIQANTRYYNDALIKDTNTYLTDLKSHYYDNIDFNSTTLAKSSIFIDRIMDYILYLTSSDDPKTLTTLQQKAITTSLDKIGNIDLKKDVIQSLLYLFGQKENKAVTDYIFKNHFDKLPISMQDFEFKNMIIDMFKTSIGQPTPSIDWDEYGKHYSLATMPPSEYYIIVFWGSTCPHCMKEMPKFNAFLAKNKNIKTIAIGVEKNDSKAGWKEETFYLENMTHVLALGRDDDKWKNKYVKDYGITATPSYFILDSNKKIIAKPYDVEKVKAFFKK